MLAKVGYKLAPPDRSLFGLGAPQPDIKRKCGRTHEGTPQCSYYIKNSCHFVASTLESLQRFWWQLHGRECAFSPQED